MAKLRTRYRTAADRAAGRVSGYAAVFYDPTRAPAEKVVTLRTKNEAVARRRLADMERKESLRLYDPWADAAPEAGVSVSKAAARYIRHQQKAGRSPKTTGEAERLIKAFEATLPAGSLINHVEQRHVERFLGAPKKDKNGKPKGERSAATKKRYQAVLAAFFAWSVKQGLRRDNPASGVQTPVVKSNRREHLTEAEEAATVRTIEADEIVRGVSRRWLVDWLVFGCRTGLRPGEQQALRWSAVNLAERVVHIGRSGRTKTAASTRTVPVRGAALDVLRRRAEERASEADGLVFTGAEGGRIELRWLSKELARYAREAGVEKHITAYSCRHSAGTRLAIAGVPLFVIARLLGTSVRMIEKHYAAWAPDAGAVYLEQVFGAAEALDAVA